MTIQQAMETATAHHRAGRLDEAAALYTQVLHTQPDNPDALHLLGMLAHQQSHHESAVELIRRAILHEEPVPEFHYNLAEALRALGRATEAEPSYRRAIELRPDYALAHSGLGSALCNQRKFEQGAESLRAALKIEPNLAIAHNNLGNALRGLGRTEEAIRHFERALMLNPSFTSAHTNLGGALAA